MAADWQVTGLRQTVRDLEKLGVQVGDLKVAFKSIGQLVADNARERAPKRTGTLANTIKASNTKNKAVVRAGSKAVPYAGVINYGWPAHNIAKHNFLDDALDENKDRVEELLNENLERLVKALNL